MKVEGQPTPSPPRKKAKSRRARIEIGLAVLVAVVATYALSLFGVHLLQREGGPLLPWT
jgi:hypothetical protein